ncbi:hypothetical protein ACFL5Y_02235 [Candidatus Omnitrophota bacterium]
MKNSDFDKEYETLKRKFAIPDGDNLKQMLATEEGKKRYSDRVKRWDSFKEKWNIVFFLKDKPIFKKKHDIKNKHHHCKNKIVKNKSE